jgi:hypothetical protein
MKLTDMTEILLKVVLVSITPPTSKIKQCLLIFYLHTYQLLLKMKNGSFDKNVCNFISLFFCYLRKTLFSLPGQCSNEPFLSLGICRSSFFKLTWTKGDEVIKDDIRC